MRRGHRVEDYLAGVLEGRERAEFERHLDTCDVCRNELEELRRLDARLSGDLAARSADREPRREWVEQVKANLPAHRPRKRIPIALVGVPAAALVLVVVLLFVFQPWSGGQGPTEVLNGAYQATLRQPFRGTIAVYQGSQQVASGTLQHGPENRWAVVLQEAMGATLEEVQIGDRIWQKRDNGQWELLERGQPLLVLPQNAGALDHLPDLFEGVTTLADAKALGSGRYGGIDKEYAVRLERDVQQGVPVFGVEWLRDHPPAVEVSLAESGTIRSAKLTLETPSGGEPLTVELVLSDYGAPTEIEPPLP